MLLLTTALAVAGRLGLKTDSSSGGYTVEVDGAPWFTGASTSFTKGGKRLDSADGSLRMQSSSTSSGSDVDGFYNSTIWSWDGGNFVTEFRLYATQIVFEQRFPRGVEGTAVNASDPMATRDTTSSAFPHWSNDGSLRENMGWLQFSGDMTGSNFQHGNGAFDQLDHLTGVKGFGPACVFSADGKSSAVFSSHSQFMAASSGVGAGGKSIMYGAQGSITAFPAGYSLSFVLALGPTGAGVNAAFEAWGNTLLAHYGKQRAVTYDDYALRYLAYSTDNGAFYYYQTEDHAPRRGPPYTPGKTYQQTLIDVKAYATDAGIPYKYILLDSWWYYQGVGSGVANWVGRPDVFPQGNAFVRNATGWPIMGHNRYWAIDNVYARANGGKYDFVIEKKSESSKFRDFAWPTEQRFWDDLMYNSTQWGLFQYEQDWLDTECVAPRESSRGRRAVCPLTLLSPHPASRLKGTTTSFISTRTRPRRARGLSRWRPRRSGTASPYSTACRTAVISCSLLSSLR